MNATADIPSVKLVASALEELMPQLLQLSADTRLEIIARLSQSLKSTASLQAAADQSTALPTFVGAWADDPEADKMEQAILSVRHAVTESHPA